MLNVYREQQLKLAEELAKNSESFSPTRPMHTSTTEEEEDGAEEEEEEEITFKVCASTKHSIILVVSLIGINSCSILISMPSL